MPGDSKTCAATGPVATFLLLVPALLPVAQVAPPAASPKSQRYSRSWKGLLVVVADVPVASKTTASGPAPDERLGTLESVMAVVAPVVAHPATGPPVGVTVAVGGGGVAGGGTATSKVVGVGAETACGPSRAE